MSDDLKTLLRPLRELEPTSEEFTRARSAIHERGLAQPASRRRPGLRPFRRGRLAVAAVALATVVVAVGRLPEGGDDSLRGALRTAAAAAAEAPAAKPFTGYRHIVERVREEQSGSASREFQREVWIDAQWHGVERIETGDGTPAQTSPLPLRSGPFGRAPLATLPTDPDTLLRALNAAYDDGSYALSAEWWKQQPQRGAEGRRYEIALATSWMIAESNATPALRAAGFGVLERLGGARDLGTLQDPDGRAGRGLEILTRDTAERWSSSMRLIFDPATGEVLSVRLSASRGDERYVIQHTYLHTEQVQTLPAGLRMSAG